jgi:hypothetical protein
MWPMRSEVGRVAVAVGQAVAVAVAVAVVAVGPLAAVGRVRQWLALEAAADARPWGA